MAETSYLFGLNQEAAQQENRQPAVVKMIFQENREQGVARGQYALPTSKEVAVVYVGGENDVSHAGSLGVHLRASEETSLMNISDNDKGFTRFPTSVSNWNRRLGSNIGGQ